MPDDFLPLTRPDISEDDIAEVVDTLRSGWLVYGGKTQRFEAEFRKLAGAEHAVAVSSCTAGMHLALLAAGVGPGDEVITSPLTFPATANVIVHAGATPVLADICADDLNIDPAEIERRVTPRTKAIMPVHYAGQPCRMDEILAIARRHGLLVIEDAATAAGAYYRGRPIGSLGDATVFSFYAIKNMTTGEGGIVTTDDAALAEKVASLRNHGLDSNAWNRYAKEGQPFYTVTEPGFKYPFTDLQASLGLGQLRRLREFNEKRTRLAALYEKLFARVPEVETPTVRPEVESNWHLYVVRLREAGISRDAFIAALRERGIGTAVHYLPVHYHPYYRERFGFGKGDYPVTEREFERLVSLPLFPLMSEADVERVVGAVEATVGEKRR
ncbi:MAG TPA: DegT/DnrJ/EryC1/StrS aminotransferase family protein [Dehalococcoidia bacterium]